MKSIPPDPVSVIKLVRDRVKIRVFGQTLVKRGVKNSNLGNAFAEDLRTGSNSFDVCRIVQWCELNAVFDASNHIFRDDRRTGEPLAAVNHSVTDRLNVLRARNDRRRGKPFHHRLDGGLNVFDRSTGSLRGLAFCGERNDRSTTDTFYLPVRDPAVIIVLNAGEIGLYQLKFER